LSISNSGITYILQSWKLKRPPIQLYQLSESKSGYICDFNVYTGKDFDPNPDGDEDDKQLGVSYNVVLGLLGNNNLLGKGYTVRIIIPVRHCLINYVARIQPL
jgi:hypothetical protein